MVRNNSKQNTKEFVLTGSAGNSTCKAMTSNDVILMALEALMPKVGHPH